MIFDPSSLALDVAAAKAAGAAHPKADPECEACGGLGWIVSETSAEADNGRFGWLVPAVQRCDECLHGPDLIAPVWDTDCVPLARLCGIEAEAEYPCVVVNVGGLVA